MIFAIEISLLNVVHLNVIFSLEIESLTSLKHKYNSKAGLFCEFTMPNIDLLKVSLKRHFNIIWTPNI